MRPHLHEWSQQCRACKHVACSHLFSCLPYSQLHETTPPMSSPYSLLVLPCTCTGFWTGAGLWQSNLFAENIPQFKFSALSLVAEPFWMTSQGQVLLSTEKILMYDNYGATTYIELCTFSIVYRSTKIDSNWLKHPVGYMMFCLLSTQHTFHILEKQKVNRHLLTQNLCAWLPEESVDARCWGIALLPGPYEWSTLPIQVLTRQGWTLLCLDHLVFSEGLLCVH
jgi:hypothetical protein